MFARYNGSRVPLNALWNRYVENSKGLIGQVQNKEVLPGIVKKFETFFEENGYIYTRPMTNTEFKEMSPDKTPVGVENFKTRYTNHYLEYQKSLSEYENADMAIKEFATANNSVLKYVVLALIKLVIVIWALAILFV